MSPKICVFFVLLLILLRDRPCLELVLQTPGPPTEPRNPETPKVPRAKAWFTKGTVVAHSTAIGDAIAAMPPPSNKRMPFAVYLRHPSKEEKGQQ